MPDGVLDRRLTSRGEYYDERGYRFIVFTLISGLALAEAALAEARRFNTPDFFWDPLIRAAVLGQLGRQPEASRAMDELVRLVPDFDRRSQSLMQRLLFLDEHVDMLLEGLEKAGLALRKN